jgi:hypothetical protein
MRRRLSAPRRRLRTSVPQLCSFVMTCRRRLELMLRAEPKRMQTRHVTHVTRLAVTRTVIATGAVTRTVIATGAVTVAARTRLEVSASRIVIVIATGAVIGTGAGRAAAATELRLQVRPETLKALTSRG